MPLYDFHCSKCNETFDQVYRLTDQKDVIMCPFCGGDARKIIVPGHGGIKTDGDVPWLASAVQSLQPDHERPIETRGEYNHYLKENNIIAAG